MHERIESIGLKALLAATLVAAACTDILGPEYPEADAPPVAQVVVEGGRAAGTGTLGTGAATPGSELMEFDFDVFSDLTGRFFAKEWGILRADGTVATVTVADSDAGTDITDAPHELAFNLRAHLQRRI